MILKNLLCLAALISLTPAHAVAIKDTQFLLEHLRFDSNNDNTFLGYRQTWDAGYRIYPEASVSVSNDSLYFLQAGLRSYWKNLSIATGPGYYHRGSSFDMGGNLQFKSDLSYALTPHWQIGVYHLSNAGLDSHNPGANGLTLSYNWNGRKA